MGMFTNYKAELLTKQPDNITKSFPTIEEDSKLDPLHGTEMYLEKDFSGKHIGYSWHRGDTLNLDFAIEGEIKVETDASISTVSGETPYNISVSTAGKRFYNLVDLRSWTSYMFDDVVSWIEDSEFYYPESGIDLTTITIPTTTYLRDKAIEVTLYNFRMEKVHTWTPHVKNSSIVCTITKDLSDRLVEGIYFCKVVVEDINSRFTIFDNNDCIFVVK